jgi:hypothetical protein
VGASQGFDTSVFRKGYQRVAGKRLIRDGAATPFLVPQKQLFLELTAVSGKLQAGLRAQHPQPSGSLLRVE